MPRVRVEQRWQIKKPFKSVAAAGRGMVAATAATRAALGRAGNAQKSPAVASPVPQAIINVSGGGMAVVILQGGIRGFRALYPEYLSHH
jgi:hypothetical protein